MSKNSKLGSLMMMAAMIGEFGGLSGMETKPWHSRTWNHQEPETCTDEQRKMFTSKPKLNKKQKAKRKK